MILEPLDFSLFSLEHLLDEEHLTLLLNELVAILLVLGSLNRDGEAGSLTHVDLALDFRVYGQCTWLDVGLTNLAETALSGGSVLLPDFQGLILLLLVKLSLFLFFLEREDLFIRGGREWVAHGLIGG